MMVSIKVLVSLVVSDSSRSKEITLSIINNNLLKNLKKMTNIKSNTGSDITLFRKVIRERNFNFKTSLPVIKKKRKNRKKAACIRRRISLVASNDDFVCSTSSANKTFESLAPGR